MNIGPLTLESPFVVSPMAGMTDTAFRRLVKRQGGCGLVVSEMVSSEGLVRGMDRTLEYAEYTEEERPVSIQIFGGDPARMAEAARVVEGMGADIVDVNMGCPVPKVAKHHAGCSLMRDPAHAAEIIAAMTRAVTIPVTVKMRKGWDEGAVNAPELARRVEGAGAAAIAVHGRTAKQSYTGLADWDLVAEVARSVSIPVFGSGDCVEPEQVVARMQSGVSGVFVGRGVLRNPWILSQARDLLAGRPKRAISVEERGQFLLDYMALLLNERVDEAHGFRHVAPGSGVHGTGDTPNADPARAGCITSTGVDSTSRPQGAKASGLRASRERWVINKLRALCGWYTKGFDGGAQLRTGINTTQSLGELHDLIASFFSAARPRWSPEDVPAIGR